MKNIVNDRCYCLQCDSSYDYKEMADKNTCQECVSHLREVKKVELRRLLESMSDEDIGEEMRAYDKKRFFERD